MRHPERALAVVAGLCLVLYGTWFAGAAVDDAYIGYAYARNLLHGHGLVYRPEAPAVEGYSNFLWTVLHVPAAAFGDPIWFSKLLGVVLLALNLGLTASAVRRLAPGSAVAPWLGVLLLAASPGFVYWHLCGMEPPLVAAALLGALAAGARRGRRSWRVEAAVWVVLALSRIDAVLLVAVALGVRLLLAPRGESRGARRDVTRVAITVLAVYAGYTIWRLLQYGGLLPNTVQAKAMSAGVALDPGLRYAGGALLRQPWLVLVPFAAWNVARREVQWRPAVLAAGACVLFQFLYMTAVGGDWMPLQRFVIPILPLGAVLVAAWASRRGALVAPLAVLAVAAGPLAWPLGNTAFEVRVHTENTATGRALGRALAARQGSPGLTAIGAAGAAPYFSGLPNLDSGGLCDAHIAKRSPPAPIPGLPPGHQRGDGAYVLASRPEILVFVLGRSDIPGQELSDAGIAFEPAFYAHYEPVTLRASRPARRIRLPRATAMQTRQLNYLAGLRPVPSRWGAAFATSGDLEFVIYQRIAGRERDPVRALFAALDTAQSAHDFVRALALLEQGATLLDPSGLGVVRAALEARYALALGDRPRAAAALARAAAAPGRLGGPLQLWVLQDPGLRTLVNTASAS